MASVVAFKVPTRSLTLRMHSTASAAPGYRLLEVFQYFCHISLNIRKLFNRRAVNMKKLRDQRSRLLRIFQHSYSFSGKH